MLHQNIRAKFEDLFGGDPSMFRSPGRVNLIGEHTDYNNGFVLPAAIDKEIAVAIAKSGSTSCRVYSLDLEEFIEFDVHSIEVSSKSWANYFLGVIAQINKKEKSIEGFNAVFGGNVPRGAGLSSSAALECVFAYAFNEIFNLGFSREEMVKMAQLAEHEYAGVKCGIMDQFASMFGKKDHVFRLDCRSLEYEHFPFKLVDYDVILCNTRVEHSLASSEYNTRRQECEAGVAALQKHFPEIGSLRDATNDQLSKIRQEVDPIVYQRCSYVVGEIARVIDSCEKLKKGDLKGFGKNMYETHEGLSRDYAVSCDELDYLVEKAKTTGWVIGARMMGGGFGGCTINLVQKSQQQAFIDLMSESYKKDMGIDMEAYVVSIEGGTSNISR